MKLSRLTLDGFKSFGHRTEIGFDRGITVLVGPNGCGKSNVVDAIKWVLGERSIKSLRSEEMLDVIFNGATDAKPSGYAEVTLSFTGLNGYSDGDSSSHRQIEGHASNLPQATMGNKSSIPFDYEEVTVTRRLHRDGESEYLINNQSCRLKDIRELFMGTGIGMEFYSIVEQGRVDFILRSSPTERRELFDEAAGISKYKAKRKEAESKLQKTDQDLLRLRDILREVRSEIRSIKIQATKAEKYKNTLEELKAKKTQLALHTYHQYSVKRLELSDKISQLKASAKSLEEKLRVIEESLITSDNELIHIDNNISSQQEILINLSGRISETKNKIETAPVFIEELNKQEEEIRQNLGTYTQKAIDLRNRLVEVMHSYETAKKESETLDEDLERKNEFYKEINRELDDTVKNLESKRNEIFQVTHKKSVYQNELQSAQDGLKMLSAKREKLSARRREIDDEIALINLNKEKQETAKADIQNNVDVLKQELQQKEMVFSALKNDLAAITGDVLKAKDDLSRISSRKEILEDLELHHAGCSQSALAVLEAVNSISASIYGIVADIVVIRPEYVNAAEAALKNLADALIVRSKDDSLKAIKFVKDSNKGRLTTVVLDNLKTFSLRSPLPQANLPGLIGYGEEIIQDIRLDSISGDSKSALARLLLGRYLLVDNLETAQEILREHLYDGGILTLDGEIISSSGIISGGSIDPGVGLISRKTELRHLKDSIQSLSVQVENMEQLQVNKQTEIESLDSKLQKIRQGVYEQTISLTDMEKTVSELVNRLSIIAKEVEISDLEQAEVEQQIQSYSERAVSTAQVIKELESSLVTLQLEIEKANMAINEYTQKKLSFDDQITQLKVKQAQLLSTKEHLQQQEKQINSDIGQVEAMLNSSAESLKQVKEKVVELGAQIKQDEELLQNLLGEQAGIQNQVVGLKERQQHFKDAFRLQKTEEEKVQSGIQSFQNELTELSLQDREYCLKVDNLVEKHKEESGADLKESYVNYQPSSTQPEQDGSGGPSAGPSQPETNWDEVNKAIEELKKRLGEMADGVNLSAIDKLKELEERNTFMTAQEQDLVKSKESLQDFIRKTNRECRERFEKTFELVKENFNQLFRKLFGGGKGELILQKPEVTAPLPAESVQSSAVEDADVQVVTAEGQQINQTETPQRNTILESGVEIIAKPPGKEPTSISLLSGGEKTLTALALIMAIFKLQPSPFCILDEADSALDENNVDRFCAMVKEFCNETQFIVITHNKKTMLFGDVLYGLTMPRPGISKKISVKMSEIDKLLNEEALGRTNKTAVAEPALAKS